MTDVTLYGPKPSTYVRTCRLALAEKGVDYALVETMPNSDEQVAHHPFGKVPGFSHGAVDLFETLAICQYVDEAFDGPRLQPEDTAGRARMTQWCSAYIDYLYPTLVRGIVIQRVVVPMRGGQTDEVAVAEAAKTGAGHLKVLNARLADSAYLAGPAATIADFLLVPALTYLDKLPESQLIADNANVATWFGRMTDRPSYAAAGLAD